MSDWELIKQRTASSGKIHRSLDGMFFMKSGNELLSQEVEFQKTIAALGYPVAEIIDEGSNNGEHYFIEKSLGNQSLHEKAIADAEQTGRVSDETLEAIIKISSKLLEAQLKNSTPVTAEQLAEWFSRASYIDNVLQENPDLDNTRTEQIIAEAQKTLGGLALCFSHLDYGLPNTFSDGVIDWQHHALAPVGYDVYPMLEITAFKGGNRGYSFDFDQRSRYIRELDKLAINKGSEQLSKYLGSFLVVKSFFFLALMKPKNLNNQDKYTKWQYRRELLDITFKQYEKDKSVNTSTFPTLAEFEASH